MPRDPESCELLEHHEHHEFPMSTVAAGPEAITSGSRRQFLVHRERRRQDRDDQPDNPRHHRVLLPTADLLPTRPGIAAGPDGNLWFTESSRQIGDDQPDDPRHRRVPRPHDRIRTHGITAGPRRQPLVHRAGGNKIGMINPTTHAITEFAVPHRPAQHPSGSRPGPTATSGSPSPTATRSARSTRRPTPSPSSPCRPPRADPTGSRRAPTATSGSPIPAATRSADQPDDPCHHRVPRPTTADSAPRDHGRPRRQPLVHRVRRQPDRDDQPDDRRHHRVRHPDRELQTLRHRGGPGWQHVVRRVRLGRRIGVVTPDTSLAVMTEPPASVMLATRSA